MIAQTPCPGSGCLWQGEFCLLPQAPEGILGITVSIVASEPTHALPRDLASWSTHWLYPSSIFHSSCGPSSCFIITWMIQKLRHSTQHWPLQIVEEANSKIVLSFMLNCGHGWESGFILFWIVSPFLLYLPFSQLLQFGLCKSVLLTSYISQVDFYWWGVY